MLLDQTTNSWSTLAEGDHFGFNEWSPDGKYVYARENGSGFGKIVRVRIKDRVLEEVLSLKDFPQLVDPFAEWYGLTPDGKVPPDARPQRAGDLCPRPRKEMIMSDRGLPPSKPGPQHRQLISGLTSVHQHRNRFMHHTTLTPVPKPHSKSIDPGRSPRPLKTPAPSF